MNHSEPTHHVRSGRMALRCLTLCLLQAFAPKAVHSLVQTGAPTSEPYLPTVGAPQLRFQQVLPPPDLVARPAAGAPPVPPLTPTETAVALANADAVQTVIDHPPPSVLPPTAPESTTAVVAVPERPAPPAILPDDSRRTLRPEDFLPFFQLPGTARTPADITVLVPGAAAAPAPAPLPPSSATYTQTSK